MCVSKLYTYYVVFVFTCFIEVKCLRFLPEGQYNHTLQVLTTHGLVQGKERRTRQGTTYFSYEGIPFAQPPLKNLRFRSPQPPAPWNGILNAGAQSSGCIEVKFHWIGVKTVGSEDCLYLNVYTPVNLNISKTKLIPVIVWIYGGAFLEGTASVFGPDNLVNNGMVVVNFNYRIGMFGFLSTKDEACPGNYGLKDQNAVLLWIKNNIIKFGGDPETITISGHSAGAASVMYHVYSPRSRGLFSRAIPWSGETSAYWANAKDPRSIAMDVALALGMKTDNTTAILQKLRQISVNDLKRINMLVLMANGVNVMDDGFPFTPTIEHKHDEAFITEDPFKIAKRTDFVPVPIMIGTATLESGLFGKVINFVLPFLMILDLSPSSVPNGLRKNISAEERRAIGKKIRNKYIKSKLFATATSTEIVEIVTDLHYTKPIMDTIRQLSPITPIYFFVSGQPNKLVKSVLEGLGYPVDINVPGVVHGEDIPYIWDYNHYGIPPNSIRLSKIYTKIWYNFALTGNPTPKPDPTLENLTWPPVTDNKNISYLWLADDMSIKYNYKKDIVDFWDTLENLKDTLL